MIQGTIIGLFGIVIIASALALIDCWIRGRYVFEGIQEERALLDAGFVPMAKAVETRQRQPVRFDALATPARLPRPHLPQQRIHNRARQSLPAALQPVRVSGAA